MTNPTNSSLDDQVDELAQGLQRCQPQLDDLARARVAAHLATLSHTKQVPVQRRSYRRHAAVALMAVCAAVVALYLPRTNRESTAERAVVPVLREPSVAQQTPQTVPLVAPSNTQILANGSKLKTRDATELQIRNEAGVAHIRMQEGEFELDGSEATGITRLRVGNVLVTSTQSSFAASVEANRLKLVVHQGEVFVSGPDGIERRIVAPNAREFEFHLASPEIAKNAAQKPAARRSNIEKKAEPSAEQLYLQAEHAIAAGNTADGIMLLERIVSGFPDTRRADAARYDLARLALKRGEPARGVALLEEVLQSGQDQVVLEPAHRILCRRYLAAKSKKARGCVRRFRSSFPGSTHDADMLAQLAKVVLEEEGCGAALPLYDEYLQQYASKSFAATIRLSKARCSDPARL